MAKSSVKKEAKKAKASAKLARAGKSAAKPKGKERAKLANPAEAAGASESASRARVPKPRRSYGERVERHFLDRGMTMFAWGRSFLGACSKGWNDEAAYGSQVIQATVDGLRLAAAMAAVEARDPGATDRAHCELALRLPLSLTAEDLADLRGGQWAKALKDVVTDPERDRLLLALESGSPEAFSVKGLANRSASLPNEPWGKWVATKGLAWIAARIDASIEAFSAMDAAGLVGRGKDPIADNARAIGRRIGSEPAQSEFFARAAAQISGAGWATQGFDWMLSAHVQSDRSWGEFWGALAKGFGLEEEVGAATWAPKGVWATSGLIKTHPAAENMSAVGRPWSTGLGTYVSMLKPQVLNWEADFLDKPWGSEEELMACFYRPFGVGEDLGLGDWAHVGDEVADIAKALAKCPVKVLLWGDPGAGKSSLAGALARHSGLLPIQPSLAYVSASVEDDKSLGLARVHAVRAAERVARSLGGTLMVVDECEVALGCVERKLEICEYLETPGTAQVWIANSLKGVHEAFLRRFDFVLRIPTMPLWCREALAKRLFGEGPLASRLAQSMRSPAELVSARGWCDAAGEVSWPVVGRRIAGQQRALGASREEAGEGFEVVPGGESKLGLADFAGDDRLRGEITKIASFFSDPARFAKLGAKIPKGYLLTGPAGSGKTLFARVLSSVAGVPMVVANGATLAQSPERFGELFAEARKRAPCLLFVDEFDVCAGSARDGTGFNLERQKIVNRLLVELDGFDPLEGVLFLGATHNGAAIDTAVRRSGRLGRVLAFRKPDPEGRQAVWKAHLRDLSEAQDFDWADLARQTRGFSSAEIAEAADRARLEAAMGGEDALTPRALAQACDVVYWGEPGEVYMTEQERWRTAIHEAGHALVAARQGLLPERATLRPREGFLGAVSVLDEEGSMGWGARGARSELLVNLAGYAAEKLVFGEPHDGASSDLERARSVLSRTLLDLGVGAEPMAYVEGPHGQGRMLSQKALEDFERVAGEKMAEALSDIMRSLAEPGEREALESLAKEMIDKRELSRREIALCVGDKLWADPASKERAAKRPARGAGAR